MSGWGEAELVTRLDVSRTPIREAIVRLAQDGLLVAANKGVRVRTVSANEARDTYAVREELDGLTAALAAAHHTPADALNASALRWTLPTPLPATITASRRGWTSPFTAA